MAPTGLKKALSLETVRLASQQRVQQRLHQGLRAADGGSVEGSAEDRVSRGIQRRAVEQIVGFLVAMVAKTVGLLGSHSTAPRQNHKSKGLLVTTSAGVTTVAITVGKSRLPGIAKHSTTAEASSGEAVRFLVQSKWRQCRRYSSR